MPEDEKQTFLKPKWLRKDTEKCLNSTQGCITEVVKSSINDSSSKCSKEEKKLLVNEHSKRMSEIVQMETNVSLNPVNITIFREDGTFFHVSYKNGDHAEDATSTKALKKSFDHWILQQKYSNGLFNMFDFSPSFGRQQRLFTVEMVLHPPLQSASPCPPELAEAVSSLTVNDILYNIRHYNKNLGVELWTVNNKWRDESHNTHVTLSLNQHSLNILELLNHKILVFPKTNYYAYFKKSLEVWERPNSQMIEGSSNLEMLKRGASTQVHDSSVELFNPCVQIYKSISSAHLFQGASSVQMSERHSVAQLCLGRSDVHMDERDSIPQVYDWSSRTQMHERFPVVQHSDYRMTQPLFQGHDPGPTGYVGSTPDYRNVTHYPF